MKITVIGAGPRGLSVALLASLRNHEVTLVDPSPLHTWTPEFMIPNLEMRSPITFDLVTYLSELNRFSLHRFMGLELSSPLTHFQIESNSYKVTRPFFCSYLSYIYDYLVPNVDFITKKVTNVVNNQVILEDNSTIDSDAVVFCLGFKGKQNIPYWLSHLDNYNILSLNDLLNNSSLYKSKRFLVVGSGQGASEITEYITSELDGYVHWAVTKTPRVYQYPVPDAKLWGFKSALGSYFSTLANISKKTDYLSKVKSWQPSITPYIANKLKLVSSKYKQLVINDYSSLSELSFDFVVLSAGVTPSIESIPTTTDIPTDPYFSSYPHIVNNFRINLPNTNWYVSGILATAYDGPRQNSLISAGITAKAIVGDIEQNGST